MRRRSHAQQIHHHQFAVIVPAVGQKSGFGKPSVGQQSGVFGKPGPVHAVEDVASQIANLGILEMLPAAQDAAEQNGGIHRRYFRVPQSLAGVDIGEVIEKSAMVGQGLPKKTQRVQDPSARLVQRNEAALFTNADRREPKAGGRDAGDYGIVGGCFARVAPVFDQAGLGVGLLPEVAKRGSLHVIEELVIVGRKIGLDRRGRWPGVLVGRWRQERRESQFSARQTYPQAGHLSEKLPAGTRYGAKLPLIHLTNLNDPALRNDAGAQTMVTGMVTPPETKGLDESECETKNLVWKRTS